MLILRLWNYIRGYVIIMVEGYFPEKFINASISRGIYLWDINREKSCIITLKVGIKAFKRLRTVVRKTNCRVHIRAKKGFPFIFYKYRKRRTFAAGCLIFIGMVYFLSSFIWTVEVQGNKTIPPQVIIDNLSAVGLKVGLWKPIVNTERVSNEMMIRMQGIAWINIDVSGTRAIVEVSERVKVPQIIEKNIPCNIISLRDGVIKFIIVKAGSPIVKVGDTVKKGDLLVAGMLESTDKSIRYVHSLAEVQARTWYEEAVNVPLSMTQIKRTGKETCSYSIKLFGKEIVLGSGKPPFEYYDLESSLKLMTLGKDNQLPFGVVINKYFEKKQHNEVISMEKAKEEAANEVWKKIKGELPNNVQITDKKLYLDPGKDAVRARMLVECLEEIGTLEKVNY